MTTAMISLKLEDTFLKSIDEVVKIHSYHNRTEFIRNALREKIEEIKLNEAMIKLSFLKGKAKTKVSKKQYEQIRANSLELLK